MTDWMSRLGGIFKQIEALVGSALGLIGQDNDVVVLATSAFVALLVLTMVWALVLTLMRGFLGLFERPRASAQKSDLREIGFTPGAREPGALDVVPGAMNPPDFAAKEAAAPPVRAAAARSSSRSSRLSQAAGKRSETDPLALHRATEADVHRVALKQLPRIEDRGVLASARPEWTGAVVPSSMQEAGAVEICKVLSRRPSAIAGSEGVRAVDYRVCGLPRVNTDGRRQPDVLVYTVADRGFIPKGKKPRK